MRAVEDLVVDEDSAWTTIQEWLAEAPYPVEVLEVDGSSALECLHGLQVTTASWLGAVVFHTAGFVVDHGWLRIYGGGGRGLAAVRADSVGAAVGHDVLGGVFRWVQDEPGVTPTVRYYAPDTLSWEDLGRSYGDWLYSMITGSCTEFYASLRWPGWEVEAAACGLDQGIHTFPPPWTAEGKDLSAVSRCCVPVAQLFGLYGPDP